MEQYFNQLTGYRRLLTREVTIGELALGNGHPIRVQTMTTTNTMDTIATVEQTIRCINAGAELVRITAPSKNEAENLLHIKNELNKRGYHTPLAADIHFTPNAAEIAARIVEKVRVNPGNYADKKKFDFIEYSDTAYQSEIQRIADRFTPLVKICKEYGTAMRIGTNHGSLSDRIMSRYGDSPMGMVESAMEFLRIARNERYHNIVLSMKSSNPLVMAQAYRLLVQTMLNEFDECYPLHLGVTEAGDGEDGRIKSAIGIGTLLEEGIGDTIRVSLTEDPEFEIPVCKDIVKRYGAEKPIQLPQHFDKFPFSPFEYKRRETMPVSNVGGRQVPVVVADFSKIEQITVNDLTAIGYAYNAETDKWTIGDMAADFIYTGNSFPNFHLPGTLKFIVNANAWNAVSENPTYLPIYSLSEFLAKEKNDGAVKFVLCDCFSEGNDEAALLLLYIENGGNLEGVILCFSSTEKNALASVRRMMVELMNRNIKNPVVLVTDSNCSTPDEHLIHFSVETGGLLLDGLGDGICLGYSAGAGMNNLHATGRTYLDVKNIYQFTNNTAFSILQATRTRISKTEYISCPSCGRTLFDLQETTSRIRAVTHHLKGVKIAIMGCIVNGPGEMADADFGYVGSGPGKITLYKGKDVVKKNVNSEVAVEELIQLLKENSAWTEPA
jgi:(E)-4-hydroxy-3-methylbut-2-enyl-diphosphate synthase